MTDRIPGAPGRCKAVVTGEELQKLRAGEEFAITLRRDDKPIREGTPYSKAAVLPDALAATLCPGVDDPAPKDALAALYTQKADTVRRATGKMITLRDAAHTPLMGLKLYGKTTQNGTPTPDAPIALESAGKDGSVAVKVMGKNLIDYRKAIPRDSDGQTVTIDESIEGLYWTGTYCFIIPVSIPAGTTVRFSCEMESVDPSYDTRLCYYNLNYAVGGSMYQDPSGEIKPAEKDVKSISVYKNNTNDLNQVRVRNIQLEIGTVATEYEPYKEPQTLTVPTPNGLPGVPVKTGGNYIDGNGQRWVCDEIDFARGTYTKRTKQVTFDGSDDENWTVGHESAPYGININDMALCRDDDKQLLCDRYPAATYAESWSKYKFMVASHGYGVRRIDFRNTSIATRDEWKAHLAANPITIQYVLAEPIVTPLTEEQLEAYTEAALHTYAPTTTITNDAGADMELTYYTPTTAVQMVHGPADKGKTFTIDEHGCVTLTKDNPVVACGRITVDGCEWYYRKWADGCAECWTEFCDRDFYVSKWGEFAVFDPVLWFPLPFRFYDCQRIIATPSEPIISIHTGESVVLVPGGTGADMGTTEEGIDFADVYISFISSNAVVGDFAGYEGQLELSGCIYVAGRWYGPEEV